MNLKEVIAHVEVWEDWRDNYKYYVPKFITEAVTKDNWTDWEKDVFNEFFEKPAGQCVSSLQQGNFSNVEKDKIKKNWNNIAPLLKAVAQSQDIQLSDIYYQVRTEIFKHTDNNKDAAVNRMLAGLQPKLLCTIVSYKHLNELSNLLRAKCNTDLKDYQFTDWCKDSNLILKIFKTVLPNLDTYEMTTYPWATLEFLRDTDINQLSMQVEKEKVIQLLKYKKQIILQGPPGTGKTKLAKELAAELIPITDDILTRLIIKDLRIRTIKGQVFYKVIEVDTENKKLTLLREKDTQNSITFSSIINSYKEKKWLNAIDDNEVHKCLAPNVYDKEINHHLPKAIILPGCVCGL